MKHIRFFVTSLLGNSLDHYDLALYGLLTPFIAQQFFQNQDPISGLILAYGLMSVSLITRPLGSWFFGKLVYKRTPKEIFSITLLGMACTTTGMGLLPSYHALGVLAPLLLSFLRALQGFFSAGEATIAPLLMLKHTPPKHLGLVGSLYQSSTVLGILLASCLCSVVGYFPEYPELWRVPFLLSSLTAIAGWFIRYQFCEYEEHFAATIKISASYFLNMVLREKLKFLSVVMTSAYSYITYSIPFVLFNTFVPLVTHVSLADMLVLNSTLLVFDMLLIPVLGALIDLGNGAKIMALSALTLAVLLVPFFLYLPSASLFEVTAIRIVIVIIGLLFLAPLQGWLYRQYEGKEKYLLIGLGSQIGTELFGRSVPFVCLLLWHHTHWVGTPAIYLAILCLITGVLLNKSSLSKSQIGTKDHSGNS